MDASALRPPVSLTVGGGGVRACMYSANFLAVNLDCRRTKKRNHCLALKNYLVFFVYVHFIDWFLTIMNSFINNENNWQQFFCIMETILWLSTLFYQVIGRYVVKISDEQLHRLIILLSLNSVTLREVKQSVAAQAMMCPEFCLTKQHWILHLRSAFVSVRGQ